MILNNLFLFILPDFCTRVFALFELDTQASIDRFEMGKSVHCWVHGVVCFDTSPLRREANRKEIHEIIDGH